MSLACPRKFWLKGECDYSLTMLRDIDIKTMVLLQEDRFGNGDVVESTAEGWRRQIFHRIRAVFGFGLGL